jgi:lysophospholipase L1-like esterase
MTSGLRRAGWVLAAGLGAAASAASAAAQTLETGPAARGVRIVLVGDSTVTEGSGWGLGFRQLAIPEATVVNTAQNGRSSKSFRDEGHWAAAIAARGEYYLIQFGHNDQPGKGPERETDPATTYPANMARYVDEVRAIGGTPILVTSLVRRTFSGTAPTRLTSSLGPWVEAVKRVAAEKQVPLIDLDASSRALCERLGPIDTARYNLRTAQGTWDTTHLDAAGSLVFATLVVRDLKRVVPALAPWLRDDVAPVLDEPPDLPPPLPLLSVPAGSEVVTPRRGPFGRVYPRALRLERYRRRMVYNGREPDPARLPPLVTSPAILVAWDYVPWEPPAGAGGCGYGRGAPATVEIRARAASSLPGPRDLQPVAVTADRARIRELLEPFEADVERVRWLAVLDPARLRPDTLLLWQTRRSCGDGRGASETAALLAADDIARWLRPLVAAP